MGLRGHIDVFDHERVMGWAEDKARPGEAVILSIAVDGVLVGRAIANAYRGDLERSGIGRGLHAFEFRFATPLSNRPHVIAVEREFDGTPLAQSPVTLARPEEFDDALRTRIRNAVETAAATDIRLPLEFMASQMARLLEARAHRTARRSERLAARQFRSRWIDPGEPPPPQLAPRALLIDLRQPDAGRDAASAAILSHASSLQRLGYELLFAAMDMSAPEGDALDRLGIASCHAPWFFSVEEVLLSQSGCLDLVYLHKIECALPYLALVRRHHPKARILYSVADLHHLRLARQAIVEERPELAAQAGRLRGQELLAAAEADIVVTHSSHEADLLRRAVPEARVHVVPWHVAPRPAATPFAQRSGLAFIGGYAHAPNLDAALWLVEEVVPILLRLDPTITTHLVGAAMPAALATFRPGVVAHGQVDDLGALLSGLRLTVAPLQYGAGIKGKVLDSLAAGVPCVCTPTAIEGLALGPALSSLVADTPEAFAASIHRLHSDRALHAACRREGLGFVGRELNAKRIDAGLRSALK